MLFQIKSLIFIVTFLEYGFTIGETINSPQYFDIEDNREDYDEGQVLLQRKTTEAKSQYYEATSEFLMEGNKEWGNINIGRRSVNEGGQLSSKSYTTHSITDRTITMAINSSPALDSARKSGESIGEAERSDDQDITDGRRSDVRSDGQEGAMDSVLAESGIYVKKRTFRGTYLTTVTIPTFAAISIFITVIFILLHMPNCCFGIFREPASWEDYERKYQKEESDSDVEDLKIKYDYQLESVRQV